MKKIIKLTVCDKCGKELDIPNISLGEMDFCSHCSDFVIDKVRRAIHGPVGEDAEDILTEQVESILEDAESIDIEYAMSDSRSSKSIDHDKICSLRLAGWTIPKIADEMGCAVSTVHRSISKYMEDYK